MALSDLFVRRIKATEQDQLKADGDGLYLFIPARGKNPGTFATIGQASAPVSP